MSLEVVSAAQMRWWIDGGSQHHYSFFLQKRASQWTDCWAETSVCCLRGS